MMNLEKFLSENLKGLTERVGHFGGLPSHNPFESYQVINKYPLSSSSSSSLSSSSSITNPFTSNLNHHGGIIDHTNDHQMLNEIASKYASSGSGYGGTGMESQSSHYGPPQMSSKEGKLKGAALSALTFLAFLFFLNILQSCMKEHIDAMNPGVTVMAGQRSTFLINRNGDANDELLKSKEKYEKSTKYSEMNYESEEEDDYRDEEVEDEYERGDYDLNLSKKQNHKHSKNFNQDRNGSKSSKQHRKNKNLKMKSESIRKKQT